MKNKNNFKKKIIILLIIIIITLLLLVIGLIIFIHFKYSKKDDESYNTEINEEENCLIFNKENNKCNKCFIGFKLNNDGKCLLNYSFKTEYITEKENETIQILNFKDDIIIEMIIDNVTFKTKMLDFTFPNPGKHTVFILTLDILPNILKELRK